MSEEKSKRVPKTLKLNFPVEFDQQTYHELTIQRPKGKHLKKMPADPGIKDMLALASRCSGIPPMIFDELDGSDVTNVCEAIGDFLTVGQ
jgi:hypothetical protein